MIFHYAESLPAIAPGRTVFLRGTVGPVVWAESPMLAENGLDSIMVAFNKLEAWEACKGLILLLDETQRAELVGLLGGVHQDVLAEAVTRAELAEQEATEARADIDVLAENIADRIASNVVDLDAERLKRRPAPSAA